MAADHVVTPQELALNKMLVLQISFLSDRLS